MQSLEHCNTLQLTATRCSTATRCNTLQHTCQVRLGETVVFREIECIVATRCNMLQHAATCCNTLQHAATHLPGAPWGDCSTAENWIWRWGPLNGALSYQRHAPLVKIWKQKKIKMNNHKIQKWINGRRAFASAARAAGKRFKKISCKWTKKEIDSKMHGVSLLKEGFFLHGSLIMYVGLFSCA